MASKNLKYNSEAANELVGFQFKNTPEEIAFFEDNIYLKYYEKGDFIIKEGLLINAGYTLLKGCVREFQYTKEDEITSAFYIPGEILYDGQAKDTAEISSINWVCLSDCEVSVFTKEVETAMYQKFPRLESMCRVQTERQFSLYKNAMKNYLLSSPEERYEELQRSKPEILQNAPQYHIASYIGIKPESLSRIRKRLAERKK